METTSTKPMDDLNKEQEIIFSIKDALADELSDAIVVADYDGIIWYTNHQTTKFFGYHANQMFKHKVEMLLPERLREQHAQHRLGFRKDPSPRAMGGVNMVLVGLTMDGDEFLADISLTPLWLATGRFVITVLRKRRPEQTVPTLPQTKSTE